MVSALRAMGRVRSLSSLEPVADVWAQVKGLFSTATSVAAAATVAPPSPAPSAVVAIPPPHGKPLDVVFVLGGPGAHRNTLDATAIRLMLLLPLLCLARLPPPAFFARHESASLFLSP